jgi:hypothetical protein
MMDGTGTERLYGLLPAVYRGRDAAQGGALRALLAVMEAELMAVEEALDAQYANWFIETCADDRVARIGELVGVDPRTGDAAGPGNHRALAANAIARRRRKGVAAALEDMARDMSGWPVRVVEYYRLLAVAQHSQHPVRDRGATVDVRDRMALARHGGPFAALATRPDMRRAATGRGRNNVANIALFVWRGESLPVGPAPAAAVPGHPGCFTFHPLGADAPLVMPAADTGDRSDPYELPSRITREALAAAADRLIGAGRAIEILADGRTAEPTAIGSANLGAWPSATDRITVDPELGRLAFPPPGPARCEVRYSYRVPAGIGGGPYDRPASADDPTEVRTFGDDTAGTGDLVIDLDPGATLLLQAADGTRPALRGGVRVSAPAGATLIVDGLMIGGQITLSGAVRLTLRHVTALAGVRAGDEGDHRVVADHSVLGPVALPAAALLAYDGVLDGRAGTGGNAPAVAVLAENAVVERTTVLGEVRAGRLSASDSVFTGYVEARHQQSGSVRYSYVPPGSVTPPRYRCQPDLALGSPGAGGPAQVELRVRPRFRDKAYGAPGYADLDPDCAAEIAAGAESGAEMGAFAGRRRPQRDAALRAALDECLPYGMEAMIIDAW